MWIQSPKGKSLPATHAPATILLGGSDSAAALKRHCQTAEICKVSPAADAQGIRREKGRSEPADTTARYHELPTQACSLAPRKTGIVYPIHLHGHGCGETCRVDHPAKVQSILSASRSTDPHAWRAALSPGLPGFPGNLPLGRALRWPIPVVPPNQGCKGPHCWPSNCFSLVDSVCRPSGLLSRTGGGSAAMTRTTEDPRDWK